MTVSATYQAPDANMYLVVRNGLHAGARVVIPETQWLVLGNGASADIALLDDGIGARHVLFKRQASVVLMIAVGGPVRIFDMPVNAGRRHRLPDGTLLLLAGVECFIGTLPVLHRKSLRAQRIHLLRRAPLRLLRLEWHLLSTPRKWIALMAIALLLLIATLTLAVKEGASHPDRQRQTLSARLRDSFPDVVVRTDPEGKMTYEGYVRSHQELQRLQAQALRSNLVAPRVKVHVMSDVLASAAVFLQRYYRGVDLMVTGPGRLEAFLMLNAVASNPAAFDYHQVAWLAQQEIAGLTSLRIHPADTVAREHVATMAPVPGTVLRERVILRSGSCNPDYRPGVDTGISQFTT